MTSTHPTGVPVPSDASFPVPVGVITRLCELTARELRVYLTLVYLSDRRWSPVRVSGQTLGNATAIDRTQVYAIVKRLETLGLVQRVLDTASRTNLYQIVSA